MKSSVILAGTLLSQSAAATFFNWLKAPNFSCPPLTDNKCVDEQKKGWSFDALPDGPLRSFSSFSFDGFSCNSKAKRDLHHKRTGLFSQKPISGKLSTSSGPGFSCGSSKQFSINQYHVTVDRDVDVEFTYSMPDGSKCSHVSSCKASGNTIQNSQCGGARSVSFKLPKKESGDCGINIHQIEFDCAPPEKPPISPPETTSSKTPSPPKSSSSPSGIPQYSAPATPPTLSESSADAPPPPQYTNSSSSPEVTPPMYSLSMETPVSPSSSSKEYSPASSSPIFPSPSGGDAPPAIPTGTCPDLLPKCLNTWMFKTNCKGTGDKDCYCKDNSFVKMAYDCMSAWGKADAEIEAAVSFFVGICAKFIPEQPGIITNCPSSVSIVAPTAVPSPSPIIPGNVITTELVMTTVSTCSPGQTITSGNFTSVLTAPSVSTVTLTSTTTVCGKCDGTSPSVTPPPQLALTTVVVDQTVTVPCTYSTGSLAGQTIPESFTTQTIATSIAVPQVDFTSNIVDGQSGIVLVPAATPVSQIDAGATPAPQPPPYATGGKTASTLSPTTYGGNATASRVPEQFLGGASTVSGSWMAGVVAIVVAVAVPL